MIGCIIGNLCGLLIQAIDRRLLPIRFRLQIGNILFVFHRLRHGRIDFLQCGGHARAIADFLLHRQHVRFHISTRNGSHALQLRAVSRELLSLLLQIGDFLIGCTQISLIRFFSKLGIQVSHVFHQSAGSITNLGFKSCYFPLYVPYASIQCCNRSLIRLVCQRLFCSILEVSSFRINFLFNSFCIISNISYVCRNTLPLCCYRSIHRCDTILVIFHV